MKTKINIMSIVVAFGIVPNMCLTALAVNYPDALIEVTEKKITCNVRIDDDFSDSRVLVVMNAEESSRLKDYSAADFPEIKNIRVKDLSAGAKAILTNNCFKELAT